MKNCFESYQVDTGKRLIGRDNEHRGKDINSHMFKHSIAAKHPTVTLGNFIVLSSGYRNREFKRKYKTFYLLYKADLH